MSGNTGGPAFSCEFLGTDEHGEYRTPWQGMTLRDYFAAKAMQASRSRPTQYASWLDLAKDAYEIADAMLRARK